MNALATVKTIIQLFPLLIELIKTVEAAIPGQGKGEAKLAMIRGILEGADAGLAGIWPAVERAVAAIVGAFNKTGVFNA